MIYVGGLQNHRLKDGDIVEHIAEMVEKRAAAMAMAEVTA
jgi:hypothetical protein